MTDERETTCPNCGAMVDLPVATVITPDSEALKDLYKGQLNLGVCDTCEHAFTAETPLIYRDDQKRTLIYYLPPSLCDDEAEATATMDVLRNGLQNDVPSNSLPACRLVMAYPQFIEKIALLQKGLDDRIVEYAKYILLQNSQDLTHAEFELLYDFSADNDNALVFIAYNREEHKAEYGLEFEKDDFEELTHFFAEAPQAVGKLDELFPSYTVNVGLLEAYATEEEE